MFPFQLSSQVLEFALHELQTYLLIYRYHYSTLSEKLVGAYVILLLLRALFFIMSGIRSSKRIHDRAISTVLTASVQHFENGEKDSFLKGFSEDVECLDEKLLSHILQLVQSVFEHAAVALIIKVTAPLVTLALIPAFFMSCEVGKNISGWSDRFEIIKSTP